jgi:hypothetical protein
MTAALDISETIVAYHRTEGQPSRDYIPRDESAKPECAACGATGAKTDSAGEAWRGSLLCVACWNSPSLVVDRAIAARRAETKPERAPAVEYKPGDKVQMWDTVCDPPAPWHGIVTTLVRRLGSGLWSLEDETIGSAHPDNFRPAKGSTAPDSPAGVVDLRCGCGQQLSRVKAVGSPDRCADCYLRDQPNEPKVSTEATRAGMVDRLRRELDRPVSVLELRHQASTWSGRNPGRRRL